MERKKMCLSVTCLIFLLSAKSQHVTKTSPEIKFQSNLQSGLLVGQKDSKSALSVNVVNGIKSSTWFGGIGVGIDYYGLKRSIPLFLNIQKDISAKSNTWFWFADAGYNFPWLMNNEKMKFVEKYKAVGGLFYEAGAGYKFTIFNKTRIGLSAGYSYKQLKEKYTYPCVWCEFNIPPDQTNNYEYRRIAIKFNWWLL
jgi:hypothetical protein